MKRILCLIDGLGSGGAQRQMVGLADLLCQNGYEVLIAWYCSDNFFKPYLCEKGIPYKFIPSKGKLSKLYGVYKIMKSFHPDCSIAYIDGPTMISCFLKFVGLKTKLIVSERNTTQEINLHQRLKFFMYQWADFVVSNSQSQTDFINQHFSHLKSKTRTIRNFIDTSHFSPSHRKLVHHDWIYLLVVARIAKQKNVIRFMEAAKRVHDLGIPIYVRWYGDSSIWEKDYVKEVYRFYRKELLGNWFEFRPSTNDILKEYQACDVFCLPSLHEGFPNAVCEAMSCSKPILCSNVNDNPTIVYHGENGSLFDPTSVEDIAEKIIQFCGFPDDIKDKMGEKSREIAQSLFSEDTFLDGYKKLFETT